MSQPSRKLEFLIDDYDLNQFVRVVQDFGQETYGYVVTPNADHLIRWHQDHAFREYYARATFTVLDSRFIATLFRIRSGARLRVCPGSDLTESLLSGVIKPGDPVVLIGGDESQVATLASQYGLRNVRHYNPPMGFANDPLAVETCLAFIEHHSPFRFCLLAVGSPRQEMLAHALARRGIARGLTLCIGASIDFLTGKQRRAPRWIQRLSLEWMYRLIQDPKRMAHRYLVRGPRLFWLVPRTRLTVRHQQIAPRCTAADAAFEIR